MKSVMQGQTFRISLSFILMLVVSAISLPIAADSVINEYGYTSNTGVIQSGKFKLNYRIEGSGPPAIVIGAPKYHARIFSENLRSHLQLIFIDHRGTAESPGLVNASQEFSLEQLLDDIELIRKRLHLRQIAVIGQSGHSLLALEYAKKYPRYVSHVIMIGSAPHMMSEASLEAAAQHWTETASPERQLALAANLSSITPLQLAQLSPSEVFIKRYILNAPLAWYDPYFDATALWEGVYINMQMFNHVWGELLRDIDIEIGLENFDRPVFLALGRYDFLIAPPASWDLVKNDFQDITIRVFEQSGHTPPYEEPELFDQELLTWMRQH